MTLTLSNEELRERLCAIGYDVPISINRDFLLKFLAKKENAKKVPEVGNLFPNRASIPTSGGGGIIGNRKEAAAGHGHDYQDISDGESEDEHDVTITEENLSQPIEPIHANNFERDIPRRSPVPTKRKQYKARAQPDPKVDDDDDAWKKSSKAREEKPTPQTCVKDTQPKCKSCCFGSLVPGKKFIASAIVVAATAYLFQVIGYGLYSLALLGLKVLIGLISALLAWWVYTTYLKTRADKEKELFDLAQKVVEMLRKQHEASLKSTDVPKYLAISHIRDELLTLKERKTKAKLWKKVEAYIYTFESRVAEQIQHIGGVEFRTWVWLPPSSVPGEVRDVKKNLYPVLNENIKMEG